MTPRERMIAAITHQPVDRVPTDLWAQPKVYAKLREHFGANANLWAKLRIDGIPYVRPKYVGPPRSEAPEGCITDHWGICHRRAGQQGGEGTQYEQLSWPLAEAQTIDDLETYNWPRLEWFDVSEMCPEAERLQETHLVMCGYMAPFYYHSLLRGPARALADPVERPEFTHFFLDRLTETFLSIHRRYFETCRGLIDVAQVTDSFGGPQGPVLSLEIFREFYKPHLQRCIDLCHEFGLKVFHHDTGSIRPLLPELVELGIDILNPVAPDCPDMAPAQVKQEFGSKLCFHGGIDSQGALLRGTPAEVRQAVRASIDALAADHTGYILAPCECLAAQTPVDNIVALYDEAWKYGKVDGKN
ncbi:MAG: uroporphyrinogen decarboxylase family protein [Phycisphaerae bacterium]